MANQREGTSGQVAVSKNQTCQDTSKFEVRDTKSGRCVDHIIVEHGDMKTKMRDLAAPLRLPCAKHPDQQLQEIIGSDGILYLRLADGNSTQVRICSGSLRRQLS